MINESPDSATAEVPERAPRNRRNRRRTGAVAGLTVAAIAVGASAAQAETVSATWGAASGGAAVGFYNYAGSVKDRANDGKCVDIERRVSSIGGYQWTVGGVEFGSVCTNGQQSTWGIQSAAAVGTTYGIRMRLRSTSEVYYLCTSTGDCDNMTL